ncbi:MAG: response regulator [FCB group bacterium]|nr:response regulator [FCB group bacterium]
MPRPSVLLVDDSTVSLRILRAVLGADAYDIVAVDSSQAALDLVRANPRFDLVLLDVAMPDLNGIDVCRRLKSDPNTQHIPVLLISGLRMHEESVAEGMKAGADGYLMKPVDENELRAWVKAALRISRVEREVTSAGLNGSTSDEEVLRKVAGLSDTASDPLHAVWAAADRIALELPEDAKTRGLVDEIFSQVDRLTRLMADASLAARERLAK